MAPVGAATAFARSPPDLGCDYYGASLHKWLGTPLGAAILYVRQDKIAKPWPIYADEGMADTDIRKLNHTGTHPVHTDLGIENAIDFHESIGVECKEARLRFLQQHWTTKVRVRHSDRVTHTSSDVLEHHARVRGGATLQSSYSACRRNYRVALRCTLRNRPVCDALHAATSSGVPVTTTSPPACPPSGPRSIT